MGTRHLAQDASESIKGNIYGFYLAVQKCFEMVSGQKVLIEKCGDVTIDGVEQIEAKHCHDPLTDNHINLWKTLRNWTQAGFDPLTYMSLLLVTTQKFGANATIAEWNEADANRRLDILHTIHREAEEREHRRSNGTQNHSPPECLSLQRVVLAPSSQQKLEAVVKRFLIVAKSPGMDDLYKRITQQHCKGILRGKQEDFLDALVGFVISSRVASQSNWEVGYEEFVERVATLTTQFCRGTQVFPAKYLSATVSAVLPTQDSHPPQLFVQKLHDIEYDEVIGEAMRDYIRASKTILEEFKNYEICDMRYLDYIQEVLSVFHPRYRSASRRVSVDIVKASQCFYDEITSEESPTFPGFDRPPRTFRNGLLHMHMDEPKHNLKWKLA
jgi:hypothetical protein